MIYRRTDMAAHTVHRFPNGLKPTLEDQQPGGRGVPYSLRNRVSKNYRLAVDILKMNQGLQAGIGQNSKFFRNRHSSKLRSQKTAN